MELVEAKETISKRFGVPVDLLTATSIEDAIVQAAALRRYKTEKEPKTTAEQFAAWLDGETADDLLAVDIEAVREELNPTYPDIKDGGEPYAPTPEYNGTPRDQFTQFISKLI